MRGRRLVAGAWLILVAVVAPAVVVAAQTVPSSSSTTSSSTPPTSVPVEQVEEPDVSSPLVVGPFGTIHIEGTVTGWGCPPLLVDGWSLTVAIGQPTIPGAPGSGGTIGLE